jgi:hypothetical protein
LLQSDFVEFDVLGFQPRYFLVCNSYKFYITAPFFLVAGFNPLLKIFNI